MNNKNNNLNILFVLDILKKTLMTIFNLIALNQAIDLKIKQKSF